MSRTALQEKSPDGTLNEPETDRAYVPLLRSPIYSQVPRQSTTSHSPFASAFLELGGTTEVPCMDMTPLHTLPNDEVPWLRELYANIYFSITHREWPFLNEPAWQSWHDEWTLNGPEEEWKVFFLKMVYAIGAALCSTIQRDPAHSARSKELYTSAMTSYPQVVAHSSVVLQIQASLLMILYALHSPSVEEMTTSVSSVAPFCTAAMAEIRKLALTSRGSQAMIDSDEVSMENMFITCYMLNEIIVSGWDRPVSAAYRMVDDDMRILGDAIQQPASTNPALSHLFRLRKIQATIRRSRETRSRVCRVEDKTRYNSSLKSALDIWRQDIPRYGIPGVPCGYLHPIWMNKLYDYSMLILMEDKRSFIEHDGTEDLFAAIVEVCLNFRRLQEEGHVMCYTWSALVFQFRAGIMLLYILWATAQQDRLIMHHSPEAISACSMNLAYFADRLVDAVPYMKVFEFLRRKLPSTTDEDLPSTRSATCPEDAEFYLEQLKRRYLHRAVLGMIEVMVLGESVQHAEMPYVSTELL